MTVPNIQAHELMVTIAMPCYNEERYIVNVLNCIERQTFSLENFEFLILDGSSTDRTVELARPFTEKHPNWKIIDNPKRRAQHAMNIAIEQARGSILIRLDAHSSYPADYIEKLVNAIKKHDAANVGAVWLTDTLSNSKKANAIKKVLSHKVGVGDALFRTGVEKDMEVDTVPFGCFDVELLRKLGGYNPRLDRNQDIELNSRIIEAGGKVVLIPSITCTYYARETWGAIADNNYQNGKWNLKTVFITKKFESMSLRHFIPLIFLFSIVLPMIAAALIDPSLAFVSVLSLAAYLAVISYYSAKMLPETTFMHLVTTFFVLHFSYGAGSLVGLFSFPELFRKA